MLKEFKQFAMRGNMIDLAIGVVLGAAFGAIIASLVKDIITPPLGKLIGGVDFTDLFIALDGRSYPSLKAAKDAGAATINYGLFLNTVINFLLVALSLFFVIKGVNALYRSAPAAPTEKDCAYCASRIPVRATRCPHCTSALG
ncbi:MAG: mechanosensitive ion channel protein MscL [Candidatus Rokubacteria bacterium 13_1_40CM_68_15]|nr:MAG: mechanosensitive ion channel protein MscL [Candidatus Rokubacteria bacterium 13_1_40CM_68_15]